MLHTRALCSDTAAVAAATLREFGGGVAQTHTKITTTARTGDRRPPHTHTHARRTVFICVRDDSGALK